MRRRRRRRQKQSGHKRKSALLFLSIGAILLLLLTLSVGTIAVWISDLDGSTRFTIVWEKLPPDAGTMHTIGVFSVDPTAGKAAYLRIPQSVLLDVPYGYKTYLASSVFRLGELDPKRSGGVLLAKSIEATMGIAVDGYVVSGDTEFPNPPETPGDLIAFKQNYFSIPGLARHLFPYVAGSRGVDTDVGPARWYQMWRTLRKLRTDQVRFFDLEQSLVLSDQLFPDGTIGKTVSIDAFDIFIGDTLQDMRIRSQEVSIEVVNATGQERLASKFGTVLERLGGHVIAKNTGKELQQDACLYYISAPEINSMHIISYLTHRRGCRAGTNTQITPTRSDLLVVLGEEFVR